MAKTRAHALFVIFAFAATAAAREPGFAFDAVAIGLLPSREYKEHVSPALGALAGFELAVFPPLSLTARSGYIAHFKRNDSWRSLVPALGGAKLVSYTTSLYLAGEAGPVLMRDNYLGDDAARASRSATTTAWGAGLGSAIDNKDLRFSVHVWDASRPRESLTFGVSLAVLYRSF